MELPLISTPYDAASCTFFSSVHVMLSTIYLCYITLNFLVLFIAITNIHPTSNSLQE